MALSRTYGQEVLTKNATIKKITVHSNMKSHLQILLVDVGLSSFQELGLHDVSA